MRQLALPEKRIIANLAFLRSLDHQIQKGKGVPLYKFVLTRYVGAWRQGWSRFKVTYASSEGEQVTRSALTDGERCCYDLPWGRLEESRSRWHVALDQIGVGWSGLHILLLKQRLRAVVSPDPLHRFVNDSLLAVSASRLHDLRLAFAVLVSCRMGPCEKSRNHQVFHPLAAEMCQKTNHETPLQTSPQLPADEYFKREKSPLPKLTIKSGDATTITRTVHEWQKKTAMAVNTWSTSAIQLWHHSVSVAKAAYQQWTMMVPAQRALQTGLPSTGHSLPPQLSVLEATMRADREHLPSEPCAVLSHLKASHYGR